MARAKALVVAGHAVRASLGDKLFGLYYAPRLRTFVVALKAARLAQGQTIKAGALAEIERAVAAAMQAAFAGAGDDMPAAEASAPAGKADRTGPSDPPRSTNQSAATAASRRPAASRSISTLSVASHVNSGSSRPKWPYAAVLR